MITSEKATITGTLDLASILNHPDLHAVVTILNLLAQYRLNTDEIVGRTGWSRATVNRVIGYARGLGVKIEAVRMRPSGSYYEVRSWGVFSREGLLDFAQRLTSQ